MTYIVDRIEDDIAVLEEEGTKNIKEVDVKCLPINIHEGSILEYNNEIYILNEEKEKKKREEILLRFNKLKKI